MTQTLATPAGAYMVPMADLARLVSESTNAQAFLNADDAAEALARIHFPDLEALRMREFMPCLVVSYGDRWEWSTDAGGGQNWLSPRGSLSLYAFDVVRDDDGVPIGAEADVDVEAASRAFGNALGLIVEDLAAVAGQSGNLAISGLRQRERPTLCSEEEQRSGGLYIEASVYVDWQ
jgi:hypothetical protein